MSDTGVGGGPIDPDPVEVEVYVVTGTKRLRLPESFCEECNLFARAAHEASERVDVPVDVTVESWWTHIPTAVVRGGYHPPVIFVGGSLVSQGEDVPSVDEVADAIRDAREPA